MSAAPESTYPGSHRLPGADGARPGDPVRERTPLRLADGTSEGTGTPPPRAADGTATRTTRGATSRAAGRSTTSGAGAVPPRAAAAQPAVRVRPAPRAEPPARPLRAAGPGHTTPPRLGSVAALERRVADPSLGAGTGTGTAAEPLRVAEPRPLPDPTPLCCAMVQAAVEGLRGVRPLAQLTRWVSPEVYEGLALRAELVQRAGVTSTSARAGIRRIRVCRLGDEAAEAAVVVDDGARVRAVAVRLEAHRGRWRATVLEIG